IELMGLSGAAFRISFMSPWCPSSPDIFPREHSARFLGYKLSEYAKYQDEDQKKMLHVIKQELNAGRPVIGINLISVPDWAVITGYIGDKLLCRSYYDEESEEGVDEESGYSIAEKFPWIIYTLEKTEVIPNKIDATRESIDFAVKHFNIERYTFSDSSYANGYFAYDTWINDLENEELFSSMDKDKFTQYWHVNAWTYNSLFDARTAAINYLTRIKEHFQGRESDILTLAIEKFKEIKDLLWENWIHFPFTFWVREEEGKISIPGNRHVDGINWTQDMRNNAAEALRSIQLKEKEAFEILAQFNIQ
ncbi:MAG: hypothetical protein ACTSPI_15415, partial [Candidatus Heimdallarchaeaceae archaeon]